MHKGRTHQVNNHSHSHAHNHNHVQNHNHTCELQRVFSTSYPLRLHRVPERGQVTTTKFPEIGSVIVQGIATRSLVASITSGAI
jgi:hypothetical protein